MIRSKTRAAQILLTLCAFEFFGPALRDAGPSHAMNPTWVGHARFHMVWFICLMVVSGLLNLYLVWGRKPASLRDLALSAAWQGTTLLGFWLACVLTPFYGGLVFDESIHVRVLGVDENVLVFMVLSCVWCAAVAMLVLERVGSAPRVALRSAP